MKFNPVIKVNTGRVKKQEPMAKNLTTGDELTESNLRNALFGNRFN